jgi:hypothetical protein
MLKVEKKYDYEGLAATLFIHAALLLACYFLLLRTPNPPIEDYRLESGGGGTSLNYGDDPNAGMGDNSNLLPIETATSEELAKEQTQEDAVEETPEEKMEATTTPTELSDEDVVALEKKEADKNSSASKNTKANSEPKTDPNKKTEPTRTFPGKTSTGGQDNNKPGDPGSKDGDLGGTRTMGSKGSGGGSGGGNGGGVGFGFGDGYGNWAFSGNPYPVDNSNEFGRIKFLLTVNEDGQIMNVEVGENYGISPSVQRIYMLHIKTLSVEAPNGVDIRPGTKIPVWYTIKPKN